MQIKSYSWWIFLKFRLQFYYVSVADQFYQSSSEEEYVIVGNDAFVKCEIPNFVEDYVFSLYNK